MSKNLYVSATEERSGKSAVVLGVMQMLMRELHNVAIFRPIINDPGEGRQDHDITLMLDYFKLSIPYRDTYAYTLKEARELINSGQHAVVLENILKKYMALEEEYDFVLCEGTDFKGKDPAFEFDLNADIAANIGSPMLVVTSGREKTAEEVVNITQTTLDTLGEKGVDFLACVVNRAPEGMTDEVIGTIKCKISEDPMPVYVIPENEALANPTIADVKRWLDADVLYGHSGLQSLVDNYVVAAMQIGNFLEYIKPGSLIITPGDRSDIILASLASRLSSSYPDIAGVLLTGGLEVSRSVHKLIEGWTGVPVPVLSVKGHTFHNVQELNRLYGRIEADDHQRIATALGGFSQHVDVQQLRDRVVEQRSPRVTPKMFEYSLFDKASRDKQRIVLPEGTVERILRAADILLRRGVAEIILLGREEEIRQNASKYGVDISGAQIIDPSESELLDSFAEEYLELRKHKGMIAEMAWDRMADTTYFGTMMVHKGFADGMVSGSVTTTAQTIRPAFEFVKTKPTSSIVSSVFLMCLKDSVLVYGDCAVNPNPNAQQLAEIAISAAETARIFGVDPKVAMLSYSTGASGKGEDVERVTEATRIAKELIKERGLDFPIEGPLQYDAAVDPAVAKVKMPDSDVAGQATVFIFPDLNTGNNTYKAVQRAANAVAIGPILQGLNKPVNDLSRGCTVPDIVNTVAITAIQAQAEKK
ncbi:phosphate acetyltransferase [Pseudodesulfovibrio piezophilus]|uniref:Phosphate acetyltransferase n=1 Tax=Pseudodesulfovibrio piezophilus (strain DSM 21447 / JCM 15486 / C1TLV30) TaxID=1322246 RepID=M1WYK3_PSEP2|nr:phosphate acetyltransferase [Pseudodesulfovibrio piezophilus]CCH50388.1 Phosphate acetyltransferase [Pseudodesulfovibrio piezophilus C1TLV30]